MHVLLKEKKTLKYVVQTIFNQFNANAVKLKAIMRLFRGDRLFKNVRSDNQTAKKEATKPIAVQEYQS